jgi:hypothetical protein
MRERFLRVCAGAKISFAEQHCASTMDARRGRARHVERSETSGLEVPSQILRKLRMTVVLARYFKDSFERCAIERLGIGD